MLTCLLQQFGRLTLRSQWEEGGGKRNGRGEQRHGSQRKSCHLPRALSHCPWDVILGFLGAVPVRCIQVDAARVPVRLLLGDPRARARVHRAVHPVSPDDHGQARGTRPRGNRTVLHGGLLLHEGRECSVSKETGAGGGGSFTQTDDRTMWPLGHGAVARAFAG